MVSRNALIFFFASLSLVLVLGLIVPLVAGQEATVHRTAVLAYETMEFVLDVLKAGLIFIFVVITHFMEIGDNLLRGADNDLSHVLGYDYGLLQDFLGIPSLGRSYYVSVRELIAPGFNSGFDPLYQIAAFSTESSLYSPPEVVTTQTLLEKLVTFIIDLLIWIWNIFMNAITIAIDIAQEIGDYVAPTSPAPPRKE